MKKKLIFFISLISMLSFSIEKPNLDNYEKQKRSGKNPIFKAKDIGMKEKLDYWN